jgi:hypothetical protein
MGKCRGRVPCNGLHAYVTRFRGDRLIQRNWRKKKRGGVAMMMCQLDILKTKSRDKRGCMVVLNK